MRASEHVRALAVAVLLAGVALLAAGCASDKLTVSVASTPETNEGKPFYAVVRACDQATFVVDDYDTIAKKLFANPADPSYLRSEVIYPGIDSKIVVKKPDTLPVAVYFLFTTPSDKWKMTKAQPLPSSLDLELDRSEIKSTN
jgi:hypothetical protein